MDSNNTHPPNTESEPRPSALKTLSRFFLCGVACQSIRSHRTGTSNTCSRVYPDWYPLGKPWAGEPHHSDSCQGSGTEFRNRRALGDRIGLFVTA